MTSAQALTSGMPASSPKGAMSDAAPSDGSDSGFGEALNSAFLASLAELKGGGSGRSRFLGSKADGEQKPEGEAAQSVATAAQNVLAALQAAPAQGQQGSGVAGDAQVSAPFLTGQVKVDDATLLMPGAVDETDAGFDAAQLLKALTTDGSERAEAPKFLGSGDVTEDVTLKVLHKETHLAIVRAPLNLDPALADIAAAAEAVSEQGNVPQADRVSRGAERELSTSQSVARLPDLAGLDRARGQDRTSLADASSSNGDAPLASGSNARGDVSAVRDFGSQQNGGEGRGDGQQGGRGERETSNIGNGAAFALNATRAPVHSELLANDSIAYETPAEQIHSAVRSELGSTDADGSTDGAVKVLQIELKPHSLGSVTVRIALKDNAVTVHIEAQRSETLAAIESDREALKGALSSAGYTVDAITSAPADASRSSGPSAVAGDGSLANTNSGQQGAGSGQAFGQGGAGESGGQQSRSGHSPHGQHGEQDRQRSPGQRDGLVRNGSGALYV